MDLSKAVKVTMNPGDVRFHPSRPLHYTSSNEAATPRCGLGPPLKPPEPAGAAMSGIP